MNPDEIQNNEMTPDEAMAALAISTRLSEQMMMQQAPQDMPVEGENGAEMAPEDTEMAETEETAPLEETPQETPESEEGTEDQLDEMEGKLEEMKSELKDTIKKEMAGFKKIISDAIKD